MKPKGPGPAQKLSEPELEGLARRAANGETIAELGREVGMSRERLSHHISSRVKKIQNAVTVMVEFPTASRHLITTLADITAERRSNAESFGNDGLAISARLARLARQKVERLTELPQPEDMRDVAAAAQIANAMGQTGLAQNEKVGAAPPPERTQNLKNLTDDELATLTALLEKAER